MTFILITFKIKSLYLKINTRFIILMKLNYYYSSIILLIPLILILIIIRFK